MARKLTVRDILEESMAADVWEMCRYKMMQTTSDGGWKERGIDGVVDVFMMAR